MKNLIEKYNTPGPRYTSYPTVPHWDNDTHSEETWKAALKTAFWRGGKEISLYIHLPFCESLCTYCGCSTHITKNHSVEEKYIDYLLKEWKMYLETFTSMPVIKEIHLGGGTPTFFSAKSLDNLLTGLLQDCTVSPDFEFGFEGHPGNTTEEHLRILSKIGFNRISLGIQDFDPEVQKTINRKQTLDDVVRAVELSRKYGFTSINFDLIYGLPKQTISTIKATVDQVIELKPSRIAFYGYAHVPWIKPAQKSFEQFLPDAHTKAEMYQIGKTLLSNNGYMDIGMDHFALPEDQLYKAFQNGGLHRSFMGYTTQHSNLLIGLGMSSISDSWTAFNQNEKTLKTYYQRLDQNEFPILRGHQLNAQELVIRKHILNLMCRFETTWDLTELLELGIDYNLDLLTEMAHDGLITVGEHGLKVLEEGKPFIRNVCMALDAKLWSKASKQRFSMTV
ncbi:MAG: oxygen-independent coproporphyrinogen III oxidase [Cyclobacteriaceae bacterium]